MKLQVLFISLIYFSVFQFCKAQSSLNNEIVLKKTDELISQRKYLSAFQNLERVDPENNNVELLLKKIEINLYYFVQSMNHRAFVLVDLKPGDDLLLLRKNFEKGAFTWIIDIPKTLDSLKIVYPNNYKINLTLAFYYGEYYRRFGYPKMERQSIISLINKLNNEAFEHGVYNYRQCYEIGMNAIADSSSFDKGVELIKKSILLNNINDDYFLYYHTFYKSEAYYNLGYIYFSQNKNELAIEHLDSCLQYCRDSSYISDIHTLFGHIWKRQNNSSKAIENYSLAFQFDNEKYQNCFYILELKESTIEKNEYLNEIYQNNKKSHLFIQELGAYYYNNNKADVIISFFENQLISEEDNITVYSNLNFYIAHLYYATTNMEKAKQHFLIAKDKYMTIFTEKNNLIISIEEIINEIDQNIMNK